MGKVAFGLLARGLALSLRAGRLTPMGSGHWGARPWLSLALVRRARRVQIPKRGEEEGALSGASGERPARQPGTSLRGGVRRVSGRLRVRCHTGIDCPGGRRPQMGVPWPPWASPQQ